MPASASDPTDVTVDGGTLTITNPAVGDFSGVSLDGTAKSATATMDSFIVAAARATGAGWNVTVGATPFLEWDGTAYVTTGGKSLPASSLSMPQLTVAKTDASSSALPSITAGAYTLDTGSSVKVAAAATGGSGMGSYTFSQGGALNLSVPASAFARVYRSEVTVSVNTGP